VSRVFVIGDLHLGHKKICEFSPERGCKSVEEHDDWIIKQWNSVVKKQDMTIVLGDVAFTREGLDKVKYLNGTKHLVFGNHDKFQLGCYLKYFGKVHGFYKKAGVWLSHAPIHPMSLRELRNVHGHCHAKPVPNDPRYICVSVEQVMKPVELKEILK
jgi:calcineurin-like phosphoesterase family protein